MVAFPQELVDNWRRFLDAEPWAGLAFDALFSIEDAASGETYYASIMGGGGQEFGILLGKGNAGLVSLARLASGESDGGCALFSCDLLSISAETGPTPPWYRKIAKEAIGGRKGLRDVPMVFVMGRGDERRGARADELRLLSAAMDAIVGLVERDEFRPSSFVPGERMLRIVLGKEGGFEVKQARPAGRGLSVRAARIPAKRLAALRALPRLERMYLVSCALTPIFIKDDQVRLLIVYDTDLGMALNGLPVRSDSIDEAAERFFDILDGKNLGGLKGLPQGVITDTRFFYDGMEEILVDLEIQSAFAIEIPELSEVRDFMNRTLSGSCGRPRRSR